VLIVASPAIKRQSEFIDVKSAAVGWIGRDDRQGRDELDVHVLSLFRVALPANIPSVMSAAAGVA
jgi:hypothetical protein